jgi:hypothetical protein
LDRAQPLVTEEPSRSVLEPAAFLTVRVELPLLDNGRPQRRDKHAGTAQDHHAQDDHCCRDDDWLSTGELLSPNSTLRPCPHGVQHRVETSDCVVVLLPDQAKLSQHTA